MLVTVAGFETTSRVEDPNQVEGEPTKYIEQVNMHEETRTFFDTQIRVFDQSGTIQVCALLKARSTFFEFQCYLFIYLFFIFFLYFFLAWSIYVPVSLSSTR